MRLSLVISSMLFLPILVIAEMPPTVSDFLDRHCYECHDDLSMKGELNLYDLPFAPEGDEANLQKWVRVFDRVKAGEMPPKEEPRPDAGKMDTFLADLAQPLEAADQKRIAGNGRARVRRLNRAEFESALSDLFSMPVDIQKELPEDAKSHGFDTVGAALNFSSVQMQAYLDVLDSVLNQATTLYPQPKRRKHRLTYREENGIMQTYRKSGPFVIQEDGVAFFATEKFSHLNAVLSQFTVPYSGKYRVKVSAYAIRSDEPVVLSLRAGGTGHAESNHVPHVFLDHYPVVEGEPQEFVWEGDLLQGHYFHVYPTSLRPMRFVGKQDRQQHLYDGPGAVVQWVEVDGPIIEEWPPASHRQLWADTPSESIAGAKNNKDPISHLDKPPAKIAMPRLTRDAPNTENGNRLIYSPKQKVGGEPIHKAAGIPDPYHSTGKLVPDDPKAAATGLLTTFAAQAFRRSVEEAEVAPFIALTHRWMDSGVDFEAAMRVGYKTMLTSPGFLYHQGTLPNAAPNLSETALAERLSFFLWNGSPDQELLRFAETGTLSDPATLRSQVERLLSDDRSDRFLKNFTDQWLDLRLIDFTVPDEKLYPEFDKLLEWSMVEETRAYVRRMLDENLSATHLVDSDFAMVNWRLAKHYGLPPVSSMEVQPVPLPADSVRGGLLTQASVLKVTANGTTTSPVVRGVWLMERLMGVSPDPPPPGIPAIEPDIRGATTVRELLDKHKSSASCASCHVKIDPPGMALESFDVIGNWRENYRSLNEELADLKPRYDPISEVPIRYIPGPAVDASYETADGRSFEDIHGFREILLDDPRQLARGLVEKLIIYSTGSEISFSDRDEVEAILDRSQPDDYGFRTLIQEVIQSSLFHSK